MNYLKLMITGLASSKTSTVASMKFARVALIATVLVSLCGCEKKTEMHLAAERGDAEAQFMLAQNYRLGQTLRQNDRKAFKWYMRAAEQGHSSAQSCVGTLYDLGWGVGKDSAEAARWHRLSAEQNNKWGQENLGMMYMFGHGVTQSYTEAYAWTSVSMANGNNCESRLKRLKEFLTPEQLKEAQQLADERLKELKANNPE